jgi:RNA polymerase sigma-70 factor (ECF subfamily)
MVDWERIVAQHSRHVLGTAYRLLGNESDAEDVSQEVFLELFQKLPALQIAHVPALLHRITTFRALDRLRRRHATQPLGGEPAARLSDGPEEQAIGAELAAWLRQAVARLPAQEAAVFCLRFFEDLSSQRIAETLDISLGAVAVALHRARANLEQWLHAQSPTE